MTKDEKPLLECYLNDQKIITSESFAQPVIRKYYDYSQKVIISLKPHVEDAVLHELDFADPEVSCDFTYDKNVGFRTTNLLLQLNSFQAYKYNKTNGQIEKYTTESGEDRELSAFRLEKGIPASMHINVEEIAENIVGSNNQRTLVEQLYYPGSAWVIKPPF